MPHTTVIMSTFTVDTVNASQPLQWSSEVSKALFPGEFLYTLSCLQQLLLEHQSYNIYWFGLDSAIEFIYVTGTISSCPLIKYKINSYSSYY